MILLLNPVLLSLVYRSVIYEKVAVLYVLMIVVALALVMICENVVIGLLLAMMTTHLWVKLYMLGQGLILANFSYLKKFKFLLLSTVRLESATGLLAKLRGGFVSTTLLTVVILSLCNKYADLIISLPPSFCVEDIKYLDCLSAIFRATQQIVSRGRLQL
jgi:hypothetical protein